MAEYKVAMLVGSLREGSLNRRLAKAIEKLAPEGYSFDWIEMQHMPFYNGDLEEPARPEAVESFVAAMEQVDAICMLTPEYNRSPSAVLKNAIDWASKPADRNVWRDKVIAIAGTSPGAIGTAVAQQHLRQVLSVLGAHVVPGETYIAFKPDLITEDGTVTDESTRDFLAAFVGRFTGLVEKLA